MEVADVAWTAVERCQHHRQHHETEPLPPGSDEKGYSDVESSLCSENQRLRLMLETNLTLLQQMSTSPTLLKKCPSDLHRRLLAAVNYESFLSELENLREKSKDDASCKFPFEAPSDSDLEKAEVLITVDQEEPSWWVWVSEEMVSTNAEEKSGIDNENYIVVGEEHVVDGVANFMARCIMANPKTLNLTPQELQKVLIKALGGINKVETMRNIWHARKMFYTMAHLGTYSGEFVPRPCNFKTCCSSGSSFEQTGLESSLKSQVSLSSSNECCCRLCKCL